MSLNYKKDSKVILLSSITKLKKILKKIEARKKLFIANWSLSETPINLRNQFSFVFKNFNYQLISFQNNFENIDNLNYFKKINLKNLKNKRKSKILPINKLNNNFYLFSKS